MRFTKETARKAARTFLQTALGYIAVNLAVVDFTADKKIVESALIGLAVSAVAAGIAAAMNLEEVSND